MNYKFPIIRTIDDVLPHIEGREEFIVAEREFGTVINYMVSMPNTFDMTGPDDLGGAVRRECRGLIFDKEGYLMSRPFHKFFNCGEREDTLPNKIDLSHSHVIFEKMDGSMIRPLVHNDEVRLGTKMGITDVSIQAEEWLNIQDSSKKEWLKRCVRDSVTPLFEWVSPENQIVLVYGEPDLVYLGTRDNATGQYVMDTSCPFNTVPQYGSVSGNLEEYIARQREAEEREGDIIRFSDGHMIKIKNDWYVRIHKALDRVRFDRNIVDLIINENIDDVVPLMPQHEIDRIRDFESRFWNAFQIKEDALLADRDICSQLYQNDRKRIALEYVPNLKNKADSGFIFKMLDGHDLRELIIEHIRKNISTNVKWDQCAIWLGM